MFYPCWLFTGHVHHNGTPLLAASCESSVTSLVTNRAVWSWDRGEGGDSGKAEDRKGKKCVGGYLTICTYERTYTCTSIHMYTYVGAYVCMYVLIRLKIVCEVYHTCLLLSSLAAVIPGHTDIVKCLESDDSRVYSAG